MMALGEHAGRTSAALATMARTLSPLTSPETGLFGCPGDASRSRVYQIAAYRSKAGGGVVRPFPPPPAPRIRARSADLGTFDPAVGRGPSGPTPPAQPGPSGLLEDSGGREKMLC